MVRYPGSVARLAAAVAGVRRRWTRAALLAVAVALSATGVASAGTAHAEWKVWQLDGDRCWDAATMNADHNAYYEDVRWDLDNDCRWDTRLWNSVGHDSFLESMIFDMNEDNRWELWLADNNQRAGFDVVYFDDTGDGYYDRWAYLTQAAPRTTRDVIADLNAGMGVVGGAPERDGLSRLVINLSRYTGDAAWAPPDRDGDGWPDHIDRYPGDPYRR